MSIYDATCREDFIADCYEAALPDEAFIDVVKCVACGAVIPKDEAERIGRDWLDAECAKNVRHYEAVCK